MLIPLSPGFFTKGVASGTKKLILANLAVHVILHGFLIGDSTAEEFNRVLDPLAYDSSNMFDWRLLTYGFVHGDWSHVLWNMIFMLPFAVIFEEKFNAVKLWLMFIASAVASGLVWAAVSDEPGTLIGASGAVSALMAAALVMRPHIRIPGLLIFIIIPFFFSAPVWLWAPFYFVVDNFNLMMSMAQEAAGQEISNVAYSAHIGGFVCSFAACWLAIRFGWVRGASSDLVGSIIKKKPAHTPTPVTGADAIPWHDLDILKDVHEQVVRGEDLPLDRLLSLARMACENGQGVDGYSLLQAWTETHTEDPELARVYAEIGFIALKNLHRHELARSWLVAARQRDDVSAELAARIDSAMKIL